MSKYDEKGNITVTIGKLDDMKKAGWAGLDRERRLLGQRLLDELRDRDSKNMFYRMYPDEGELGPYWNRRLYGKHLQHFRAGRRFGERVLWGGNRTGKTHSGAYELTAHATGEYPSWWEGKRFDEPVRALAAGEKNETVRKVIQEKLLGGVVSDGRGRNWVKGTGMIPEDRIVRETIEYRTGFPHLVDNMEVRYRDSRYERSLVRFQAYEQGVSSYEGISLHYVWLDEEPPEVIYNEVLARVIDTEGILSLTFTPRQGSGVSGVVMRFLPEDMKPEEYHGVGGGTHITRISWDDVPHLSERAKGRARQSYSAEVRKLKEHGDIELGSGRIYPMDLSKASYDSVQFGQGWSRVYAIDPSDTVTAALWGCLDREQDILYIYSEYYSVRPGDSRVPPSVHAQAIKARGEWIPGVIDPAARGMRASDGEMLVDFYRSLGLDLSLADNSVQSGLEAVYDRLATGRLKIWNGLPNFRTEFNLYRRDEKGNVLKKNDHLMDCLRYIVMSGTNLARSKSFSRGGGSSRYNAMAGI